MIGAGTNHARIGGLLRQLAQYYHKDPNALFCVRLAQGFLHTGKGSITLSPFHTDRTLMSSVAVAGLLSTMIGFLDVKNGELHPADDSCGASWMGCNVVLIPRLCLPNFRLLAHSGPQERALLAVSHGYQHVSAHSVHLQRGLGAGDNVCPCWSGR